MCFPLRVGAAVSADELLYFFDVSFLRPGATAWRCAAAAAEHHDVARRMRFVVGVFLVAAPIALDGRMNPFLLTQLDGMPPLLRRRAALGVAALDAVVALRTLATDLERCFGIAV